MFRAMAGAGRRKCRSSFGDDVEAVLIRTWKLPIRSHRRGLRCSRFQNSDKHWTRRRPKGLGDLSNPMQKFRRRPPYRDDSHPPITTTRLNWHRETPAVSFLVVAVVILGLAVMVMAAAAVAVAAVVAKQVEW